MLNPLLEFIINLLLPFKRVLSIFDSFSFVFYLLFIVFVSQAILSSMHSLIFWDIFKILILYSLSNNSDIVRLSGSGSPIYCFCWFWLIVACFFMCFAIFYVCLCELKLLGAFSGGHFWDQSWRWVSLEIISICFWQASGNSSWDYFKQNYWLGVWGDTKILWIPAQNLFEDKVMIINLQEVSLTASIPKPRLSCFVNFYLFQSIHQD